jgi:hypothetical protein
MKHFASGLDVVDQSLGPQEVQIFATRLCFMGVHQKSHLCEQPVHTPEHREPIIQTFHEMPQKVVMPENAVRSVETRFQRCCESNGA